MTDQQAAREKLWERAASVGFTPESLYRLLVMVNVPPDTLTIEAMRELWPYINPINAEKFKYGD